jgi:TP901 family phage tail tape measure protein
MNNIGIGGILTFNPGNAVYQLNAVARASQGLASSQAGITSWASSINGALNSMGQASLRAGLALAPLTAAFIAGGREAARFEQQMDIVKGVSEASELQMAKLSSMAKNLGLDNVFDPVTVGKGMEELARAGLNANETLQAIRGTMAAAAADGMQLGQATEIVVNIIRSMGLTTKDTGRVADVLALASARTTTDIKSLGSSMKYAASQAATMKIPLEETVSMLALASDAGLKGTLAGTSFANTLRALASPNKKAAAWMKKHNIEMSKTADGGLDVIRVFKQINSELDKEGDVLKKSATLTAMFGRWGEKAFNAISKSIPSGKFDRLVGELKEASGSAQEIADARLDNFLGQFTRLSNIAKTGAIELWTGSLERAAPHLKTFATNAREIVRAIIMLNEGMSLDQVMKSVGDPRLLSVAQGLRDGFAMIFDTADRVIQKVVSLSSAISDRLGPDGVYTLTKFATLLFGLAAALSPVLIGFGTFLFVMGPILTSLGTIGTAIGGIAAALPELLLVGGLVFGGIASMIALMSREGETWYQTVMRTAFGMYNAFQWVMNEAILPMANMFYVAVAPAIMTIWEVAKWFGSQFKAIFADAVGSIIIAIRQLMPVARLVFGMIAGMWGITWRTAAAIFATFVGGLTLQFKAILLSFKVMITGILAALHVVGKVALAAAEASGQTEGSKFWADIAYFVSQDPAALLKPDAQGNIGAGTAEFGKIGAGWEDIGAKFGELLDGRNPDAPGSPAADIFKHQKALADSAKDQPINVAIDDKRKLDVNNCMNVDGRNLAVAQGRHQQEIQERAGFKTTPWQRRAMVEVGAVPVGGMGGGL